MLESSGDFIVRMDADDISIKTRFLEQITYLVQNPNIGMVGTRAIIINEKVKKLNKSYNLCKYHEIE